MTSKARQKVDPNIRDMFDAEVDRPDHDRLMLALFNDEAALTTILAELHGAKPLPPITPQSTFLIDAHTPNQRRITYEQAVKLTSVPPSWADSSPIRLVAKRMEVPLEYSSADGRYGRVVGFIDIAVIYRVMKTLHVAEEGRGARYAWEPSYSEHAALIEIKSAWPTVGNLVRQLQLYRVSQPVGFKDRPRSNLVVGPDDTVNDVLCEHQFRLVTFEQAGGAFRLVPQSRASTSQELRPGQF